MKFNIIEFKELDSTNNYIKNNINILNNLDVIFTSKQTQGRGQFNRKWYSLENESLTFSILIKYPFNNITNEFKNLLLKNENISLYIGEGLNNYFHLLNINTNIKLPNDILYKDKKLAGILTESSYKNNLLEYIIIGIGININQDESFFYKYNIKGISLKMITGNTYNIREILKNILEYKII